jgi:hypothetical protein
MQKRRALEFLATTADVTGRLRTRSPQWRGSLRGGRRHLRLVAAYAVDGDIATSALDRRRGLASSLPRPRRDGLGEHSVGHGWGIRPLGGGAVTSTSLRSGSTFARLSPLAVSGRDGDLAASVARSAAEDCSAGSATCGRPFALSARDGSRDLTALSAVPFVASTGSPADGSALSRPDFAAWGCACPAGDRRRRRLPLARCGHSTPDVPMAAYGAPNRRRGAPRGRDVRSRASAGRRRVAAATGRRRDRPDRLLVAAMAISPSCGMLGVPRAADVVPCAALAARWARRVRVRVGGALPLEMARVGDVCRAPSTTMRLDDGPLEVRPHVRRVIDRDVVDGAPRVLTIAGAAEARWPALAPDAASFEGGVGAVDGVSFEVPTASSPSSWGHRAAARRPCCA